MINHKNTEMNDVDQTPPISACKCDLSTPLNQMTLFCKSLVKQCMIVHDSLKGQYHGRSMGDIMIFGQNSLTLNFEHCVT